MGISEETLEWARRIGAAIRSRRKFLDLTLEDVSQLSGSTVPTLSHIERGTRDVKLSTLVSLAKALRTDLPSLIGVDPDAGASSPPAETGDGYDLEGD